MSAGVSDQRMKGQGNQVSNVPKEQQLEGGEEVTEASWRHQQPSYAPPISTAADPYTAAGYYGTAGIAALPYQAFGVGDGTWSTNGTDPMTFLGGYTPHESYGMDGVFGPSTTAFSTAAFGQPASNFNYFHGNGDYSTWGQPGRTKQYDEYYRPDGLYVPDGLKAAESGMQALGLSDRKMDKSHDNKDMSQPKKTTWASIASQPAKPTPAIPTGALKKKGPGMPPPPIVPGKHNMDIGTWDAGKTMSATPPMSNVSTPQPQPVLSPPPQHKMLQPTLPMQQMQTGPPPSLGHHQHQLHHQHQQELQQHQQELQQHQQELQQHQQEHLQQHQPQHQHQQLPPPQQAGRPTWSGNPRGPPEHRPPPQQSRPPAPLVPLHRPPPPMLPSAPQLPHPVLDELRVKNDYNPTEFDLSAPNARFFVIKSYSEDDIHRSIKYEIWCSTEHGNKRLDSAYRERERENGCVYLFFSVNGSGHFCGMARMATAVDYGAKASVWSQDKWKGQFRVRWIYVKDVPNVQLKYIRLENNENKPVTNSRDTQEVPHAKGVQVLRILHEYHHSTSIFDDFIHYEKKQEEEDSRKVVEHVEHHPPQQGYEERGRGYHREGGYRDNEGGGGFRGRDNRAQSEQQHNMGYRDRYQGYRPHHNMHHKDRGDMGRGGDGGHRGDMHRSDGLSNHRDNHSGLRDNHGGPRDNYGGSRDNRDGPRDNRDGPRDIRDGPRDNRDGHGGQRDNRDAPRDNHGGPRDNHGGPRDNRDGGQRGRGRPRN